VTKSDISKNEGKGFYLKKRTVLIEKNEVENNDEEGIDIRSGVKGSIKKNTITKNGESGIELVVGKTDLKISNNKIKSNGASGISNQFYKDSKKTGDIKLEKNSIQKNDNYGLQCATPSGGDPSSNYWTKSINLIKNIFSGNGKSMAKSCKFPISTK
jgi:parallel beta-helix repeat protein